MRPQYLLVSVFLSACGGAATTASSPSEAPAPKPTSSSHPRPAEHSEGGHGGHAHRRFDKAEEWVARFEGPERDAWQKPELVIAAMSIRQGMVVADIGAGTGYFLPYLASATGPQGRVVGLDIEPDMVRYMSERIAREDLTAAEARLCQTDDPALSAASTDRILIVDTWHHISDRVAYSAKLAAALRPQGALYIVDFKADSPHGPPKEMRLSADQVIAEVAAAGFRAEIVETALPYQWVVRAQAAP